MGLILKAEMIVSVGARFYSKRYIFRNLRRWIAIWRASIGKHNSAVLLCYSARNSRDRRCAKRVSKIIDSSQVALEFTDGKVGHHVFSEVLERGELGLLLLRTVFSEFDSELFIGHPAKKTLSFPANKIRFGIDKK